MELSFNLNIFLIQAVIYIGVLIIVKFLYFDPILRLVKKRESLTLGRQGEAVQMTARLESARTQYSSQLDGVKNEQSLLHESEIKKARGIADEQINQARVKVEMKLLQAQKDLNAELAQVRSKIPPVAESVAAEIAAAVMSAKVVRAA